MIKKVYITKEVNISIVIVYIVIQEVELFVLAVGMSIVDINQFLYSLVISRIYFSFVLWYESHCVMNYHINIEGFQYPKQLYYLMH